MSETLTTQTAAMALQNIPALIGGSWPATDWSR